MRIGEQVCRALHQYPIGVVMPLLSGFIAPCLPMKAQTPPSGSMWVHEIKHDGFRMMVRRDVAGVRLLTRNGHDWTDRYPLIFVTAAALQVRSWSATQAPAGCRPIQYVRATPVR